MEGRALRAADGWPTGISPESYTCACERSEAVSDWRRAKSGDMELKVEATEPTNEESREPASEEPSDSVAQKNLSCTAASESQFESKLTMPE